MECEKHGWVRKVPLNEIVAGEDYDVCMECSWAETCSEEEVRMFIYGYGVVGTWSD